MGNKMKGEISYNAKNKPQCNHCHDNPKRGNSKGYPFCNRIRRILEGTIPPLNTAETQAYKTMRELHKAMEPK